MALSRGSVVVLTVLAACAPAEGPAEGPAGGGGQMLTDPPAIYSLLGYRDRLVLTSEQVEALDSLARALQEENRSSVGELSEMARRSGRRQGRTVITEEMRPLVEQVIRNNDRAEAAVREVLDDKQEKLACNLNEDDRRDRARRREPPRAARRRDAPGDSTLVRPRPGGWSWCQPEEEATTS